MAAKKGRKYSRYSGTRADQRLGIPVDHNIQYNDMPDVGQYVVINDLRIMEKAYTDLHVSTVYEYNDGYLDARGNPIVYKVEGYTRGQENALDPRNKVMLVSTTANGKLTRRTQLKTILIATGSMELEVVDPEELKEVGFRTFDSRHCLIDPENMRVVERTISQGKMERICRQNKHI